MEQDGIYINLLMEENDFTTTTHNLLTQSRFKKGSDFTTSTKDKIWNKAVFRHSLRSCILVKVMFGGKKDVKKTKRPRVGLNHQPFG